MSKKEEANLEGGLPSHEEIKVGTKPEIMGQEPYVFSVDGKEWGNLPKDWTLREATAVGVNSKDQVIVFNRGTKPIIIFDPNGKYINSWGDDIFKNPHGITIDDDDYMYCVDNGDSTVRKFDSLGKLQFQIGEANKPSKKMSGIPFSVPTQVAVDSNNKDLYCLLYTSDSADDS